MALALLKNIDEIDPAWLGEALLPFFPNMPEISSVAYKPIGNGNANDTFRVEMGFAGLATDAPESVILKIHASDPATVEASVVAGVYRSEHEMTQIISKLQDLRTPDFYHSNISDDDRTSNILMQDLSEICEAGDQIKGMTPEQALSTVRELTELHKYFWNSPQLESLDSAGSNPRVHRQGAAVLQERLGDRFDAEQMNIVTESLSHIDTWLDYQPRHRTLIHTDCRADNILFDMSNPATPAAYLIDWASCAVGDGMADIAYLLASSVKVEDRKACEDQAIAYYAEEIGKVDPSYSVDQARENYRKNITSSMFKTLLAAAFIPQTEHTDLLLETLARRNIATHKDWLFS